MNALADKEAKEEGPIMPEEIRAVIAGIQQDSMALGDIFWRALARGDWFIKARERIEKYERGNGWEKWLRDNFEGKIGMTTIRVCMRLAVNRSFLIARLESQQRPLELDQIPTIAGALRWISEREESEGKSRKRKRAEVIDVESSLGTSNGAPSGSYFGSDRGVKVPPPPEVEAELKEKGEEVEDPDQEPLSVLRDRLQSYAWQRYQMDSLEAEIIERIRIAELTVEQVTQCVNFACLQHEEVREAMLRTFMHPASDPNAESATSR